MSTARRRLGTGPATTRSTPPTDTAPRLLAAERAEPDALLGEVEQRDVVDRKGRRNLGPGALEPPTALGRGSRGSSPSRPTC